MTDGQPRFVWVDGAVRPADAEHLSVFDRGFQLGDAVFETLRARAGRVTELPEHVARLRRSAEGLGIEVPEDVGEVLAAGIAELLAAESLDVPDGDASIRVTVSRGRWFARGLLPPPAERLVATVAIQAWPVARHTATEQPRGISVVASAIRRDPGNPMLGLKTTSRADYVYAKLEARRAGADDAVFLTVAGHLSEATTANLFLVRVAPDGVTELATPSLDCAILAGTTRAWLVAWAARVGLRPVEGRLAPEELAGASEAFISSSVAGIVPVVAFDGGRIGDGMPGPWTLRARADREAFVVDGRPPASRD
jgi:branched-chain amino acid aminotransferase